MSASLWNAIDHQLKKIRRDPTNQARPFTELQIDALMAAVSTGEPVVRESVLPGAILTRVARSHIRVGTFQYFAARRDAEALRQLADYTIERLYPSLKDSDTPYLGLLDAVIAAQAELVARWMNLGFIHGVMNTDNVSISGETIDYGPCAFMDEFDPDKVFSSIDQMGRYAYSNQPRVCHWNLVQFAQAILSLLAEDETAASDLSEKPIERTTPSVVGRLIKICSELYSRQAM